jgi:hypothetical protein
VKFTGKRKQKRDVRNNTKPKSRQTDARAAAYQREKGRMSSERKAEQKGKAYLRREALRFKVFVHYSGGQPKCACCGERNIGFLTIDHINNDGAIQRRRPGEHKGGIWTYAAIIKKNFPKDLRVLCYNCNCGRGRLRGRCPHAFEMINRERRVVITPIMS